MKNLKIWEIGTTINDTQYIVSNKCRNYFYLDATIAVSFIDENNEELIFHFQPEGFKMQDYSLPSDVLSLVCDSTVYDDPYQWVSRYTNKEIMEMAEDDDEMPVLTEDEWEEYRNKLIEIEQFAQEYYDNLQNELQEKLDNDERVFVEVIPREYDDWKDEVVQYDYSQCHVFDTHEEAKAFISEVSAPSYASIIDTETAYLYQDFWNDDIE